MERKYYLRGLGIGIAVTAIIMGIALPDGKEMTDAEVIARARKLGMVENTVLSDLSDDSAEEENTDGAEEGDGDAGEEGAESDEPQPQAAAEAQRQDPATAAGDDSASEKQDGFAATPPGRDAANDGDTPDSEADDDKASAGTAIGDQTRTDDNANGNNRTEGQAATEPGDLITSATIRTINVTSGDGSYTVARKLADVGVVLSAESFDTFLCQNGYDKKLRPGTFSIPADASDEQIARIVTGAE